jgi:hypothetical protein
MVVSLPGETELLDGGQSDRSNTPNLLIRKKSFS